MDLKAGAADEPSHSNAAVSAVVSTAPACSSLLSAMSRSKWSREVTASAATKTRNPLRSVVMPGASFDVDRAPGVAFPYCTRRSVGRIQQFLEMVQPLVQDSQLFVDERLPTVAGPVIQGHGQVRQFRNCRGPRDAGQPSAGGRGEFQRRFP